MNSILLVRDMNPYLHNVCFASTFKNSAVCNLHRHITARVQRYLSLLQGDVQPVPAGGRDAEEAAAQQNAGRPDRGDGVQSRRGQNCRAAGRDHGVPARPRGRPHRSAPASDNAARDAGHRSRDAFRLSNKVAYVQRLHFINNSCVFRFYLISNAIFECIFR